MTALPVIRSLAVTAALGGFLLAPAAQSASADVDDFDYSSWDARYELSLDDEGRAVLHAQEHVVAEFPDTDQNKGIVRGFAQRYEGARLDTTITSVTDADGAAVPYETDTDDDVLYVLTGTDEYVHGPTDYVISYEMHDVMLTAQDTGGDEFYWDLLPLDSSQGIDDFHAEIIVAPALAERFDGNASCYQGYAGSTDRCELTGPAPADGGAAFSVSAEHLLPSQGVTVAIGFEQGTVVQPASREPNALLDAGPALGALGTGLITAGSWFAIAAHRRRRRTATGIIIAQFDVPDSLPPLLAAELIAPKGSAIAAEMLHLAVRGNVRLEDQGDEHPVLHRLDGPVGDPLDQEMLDQLFPEPEQRSFAIPSSSETFAKRMSTLLISAKAHAAARGLLVRERVPLAMILLGVAFVALIGSIVLAVLTGIQGRDSFVGALFAVGFAMILLVMSAFFGFNKQTLMSRSGAEQREYLEGVREFIRVAEADRFRMLQSYSGAERYTQDGRELIRLYERLLPYSVLFGMEKEWSGVLDTRYSEFGYEPSWMTGYHAGILAGSVSHFQERAGGAATYSSPGSSSSFSGSGGGGFSGGGGGGGFSGGR